MNPLATSARYSLRGEDILLGSEPAGRWLPDQSRIEWSWEKLGVDQALKEMALAEGVLWDDWADHEKKPQAGTSTDRPHFSLPGWLKRYPDIGRALERAGVALSLRDKVVLDIGGSGKDIAYWLREAPARIDQVEVSPRSQFLAQERLGNGRIPGTDDVVPIFYHTVPAENLPFDDGVFDVVFSRSTLHHCRRPDGLKQVARVLKPGGILLFVEPHLSDFNYWLMVNRRKILKVDRGTDNPLRSFEVDEMLRLLGAVDGRVGKAYSRSITRLLKASAQNEGDLVERPALALRITLAARKADAGG